MTFSYKRKNQYWKVYCFNVSYNYTGVLESAVNDHTRLRESMNIVNEVGSVCDNIDEMALFSEFWY